MRVPLVASVAALVCGTLLFCRPAHAVPQRTAVTDVVQYTCTPTDGTGQSQHISVQIVLTMPTDAKPGEQLEIGWQGTYLGTGLVAPAGFEAGIKLYAYAGISEFANLTSATGVAELGAVNAGEVIPLPPSVTLRTTAQAAGTGKVRPGAINFGPTPTQPLIECEVQHRDELKYYTLTVGAGSETTPSPTASSPEPTPTPSTTPQATMTETGQPDEETRRPAGGVITTPVGGVDTGGGGELGPDGRHLIVIGSLLVLAAAGAGFLLRRRTVS